jgi:hypothetical protein
VHPLVWLGVILMILWGVLWLGFQIVSGLVHLIMVVALALIVWGLVKKGARAVGNRV